MNRCRAVAMFLVAWTVVGCVAGHPDGGGGDSVESSAAPSTVGSSGVDSVGTTRSSTNPVATATTVTTTLEATLATELPTLITCNTQYQPRAETEEGAEAPELTVTRSDRLEGDKDEVTFANMSVRVVYVGDAPEGRSVWIHVETESGEPLATTLYQMGDLELSEISFSGGHGFTGLHDVEHSGSLLQIWCTATD